ncbi:MAG: chitobiase/beta-hexosaminidase C-terminal domain-containing protein, partial [Bacteroidota bacterium]
MKTKITLTVSVFLAAVLFFSFNSRGQEAFEDFENFPVTGSSYESGTFEGQDGSTWEYENARGDANADIDPPTPGLQDDAGAMIESGTLTNGIDELEFDYMQMFSSDVELDIYIDGDSVTTVTSDNQKGEVLSSGPIKIDGVDGDFKLRFQNTSSGGQVAIDNVYWFVDTGVPVFLVDPGSFDFSSIEGEGPSESQSFELIGLNLDGSDVTVSASTDFEISEDNTTFSNEINLTNYENDTTDIYVRLAEGLEPGDYTDSITVSGGGAAEDTVAVTGKIVEQFDIPYVNDFRSQEDVDVAKTQGFNIENAEIQETNDPYLKITDGYVETPTIDFTQYDTLAVEFDAETYGGEQGQELSVLVSDDNGTNYDTLQSYSITGTYTTYALKIDLTDTYDVTEGKIKIEMTDGGGSTRFRDLLLDAPSAVAAPTFNPEGGDFQESFDVEISTITEGSTIYYSTESDTDQWTEYTEPVTLNKTTTLWAFATKDDIKSDTISATYNFSMEELTIPEIRETEAEDGTSPYEGELVSTSGVVTANDGEGFFMQDGVGAWNGIYVFTDSEDNPEPGTNVE